MVQVTERARENAKMYGIEPAKIIETAEGSTEEAPVRSARKLTAPWGAEYTLHRGGPHLASDRKDYFVIVLTEERDGETVALSVHVVPERIPTDSRDPLELLKRLVNYRDFGLGVLVGDNPRTFVSVEDEPSVEPKESAEGVELKDDPPEGHEVALEDRTCQLEDGEIQVLLTFAIDATAVRKDLGLG